MVLFNNLQSCNTKHKMERAASQLWASFEMKRQQEACREQKREVKSVLRALTTNHAPSTPSVNQSQQRIPHHVRGKLLHHQTFTITFFFLFWSLSSNNPHFLSDREIDFLKISSRRNNPPREWVWVCLAPNRKKNPPRVCFVSWSCLISLFCVMTVMAACSFSQRCAHWLIPITTSPLLVISQARFHNVSWSYLVLTSHVVPDAQPLTARVRPLTRVQVRTRWLLWQPGTRLVPTGVKRRSKPSGTDRQRLMEFEESGIGEECGVFGCVAAGEWPTQLEVAQILSLGLVALQHR